MGRKNNREAAPEPLDVAPVKISIAERRTRERFETEDERRRRLDAEFGRRRERTRKRKDQQVLEALVDWDHCCIPGCDESTLYPAALFWGEKPDPSRKLPICFHHQAVILAMLSPQETRTQLDGIRERLALQRVTEEIAAERKADIQYENGGAEQGQIYIIRQGGLIKVGWSSKLRSRLKHYGAGVEILAHYPATRREETDLHRSLRPYLAKGREWYQDCQLLADVVAGIHKRHGTPKIFPVWTEPKPALSARPKGFPAA